MRDFLDGARDALIFLVFFSAFYVVPVVTALLLSELAVTP